MNKKERYIRQNWLTRHGTMRKVRKSLFARIQHKQRELVPKHAKFGDMNLVTGEVPMNLDHYQIQDMRNSHDWLKDSSRYNKNFRRWVNPNRDKRKYWEKGRERDPSIK